MGQITTFFNKLNGGQKAIIVSGVSILLIFLISIIVYSKSNVGNINHNYIIAKDLSKNEIMIASNELEAVGVPFSLFGSGDSMTLKTSKQFINIAKIKLVASGALKGDHKGWEIFDKSSIGETSFQNKIKYTRAIEGELSRALESLTYVKRAQVKVVLPKDSIFTDKKLKSTASAMLVLNEGRYLTATQIKGVKSFIASAIQDLHVDNIQLINQTGELLEDVISSNEKNFKSQVQYKNKIQSNLEEAITSLLEPVIGDGNIVAKVNIQLDFTKKDMQEEKFSPEGTIRSRQSDERLTNESRTSSSGDAASSNDLGNGSGANGKKNNEHIITTTNYEISKTVVNTTNDAYANIQRITAAITFNEKVLEGIDNPKVYLLNIEDLVKDAIGFSKKRGDKITVKSFKFAQLENKDETVDTTVPTVKYYLNEFGPYIKYIVIAILLFVLYKKFMNSIPSAVVSGEARANNVNNMQGKESASVSSDNISLEDDTTDLNNLQMKQAQLKKDIQNKVLSQLTEYDALDAETKIKFETLSTQLSNEIVANPESIARMIELLLDKEV